MGGVAGVPADGFDEAEETLTAVLAEETVELAAEGHRLALLRLVLRSRGTVITLVALVLFAVFSLTTSTFLTSDNLFNILRNISFIGIVATGMTFLLVAGEIDLSVGSVFGFLTVVMGVLVARLGISPWPALLLVIALGALVGLVNGLISTRLAIPSFVVTLAGFTAYRSAALLVSGPQPSAVEGAGLFYQVTGGDIGAGLPWLVVWMAVVMLIGGVILATTKFGYHVYATGGSLEAARNSGIDTRRVKLICFMLTSGLCGLVAALIFGYLHGAAPTTGTGFEFRVIGAVIVGGVALTGGRGSVYGSLMGAVIIGMITNGLVQLGYSQYYGDVATGVLIMLAGALDLYTRFTAARSLHYLEG